jgi:CCR4-NOT complex subunit CAF16
MNPIIRRDIRVSAFLDSVGGYRHKERRNRLLDILDIDLDWRMHQISDGERRRVQLCFGLMVPWDILLLDEVRFPGAPLQYVLRVKSGPSFAGHR